MKKQLIMAVAFVMISVSVAIAQEGKVPANKRDKAPRTMQAQERGHRMDQMKTELGLTEDQVAKIKAIHKSSKVKPEGPKAELTEAQKAEMKKARQEEAAKIRAVLTKEQQVKFDQMNTAKKNANKIKRGAMK
jgi:Spy/CpxP family protein refolding chaperone